MRNIPRPLAALLLVAALQALAWAIVQPPLQGPDEVPHVAYVQKIVEARTIPWNPSGNEAVRGSSVSGELRTAIDWGGVEALRGNLSARPPGTDASVELWRARDRRLDDGDRADGGFTSAMANPPAYYLYATVPYLLTSGTSIFDRAFAMRLWSIPLLLVVVALTWLVAGELAGGRRWAQVVATAAVALNPQAVAVASAVNPDLMLAAAWTGFLYVAVVTLKRGPTRGRVAGLVALSALSCLTHSRGVAIIAPLALTLAIAGWRRLRPAWNLRRVVAVGTVAAIAAVGLGYGALHYVTRGEPTVASARQFVSYLWQFYLPSLGSMQPPPGPQWDARDVFVDRWYSGFVQFDVSFSPGTLDALMWTSLAILVLAALGIVQHRRAVARRLDVVAVVAVGLVAYLLQSHLAAFRNLVSGGGDPVLTGRYLLPFLAVYGLLVAAALSWLPRRALPLAAGVLAGALVVLGLSSFGLLVERFYA